jgi:hypothetical protein
MGTSTSYGGSRNGLIPSWIDEPVSVAAPGAPLVPPAGTTPGAPGAAAPPVVPPNAAAAGELRGPRSSFSHFVSTGSRASLGSALSNYVRHGTGGAGRAAQRMGASRATASQLLGIVRDVQSLGAAQILSRFNLSGLSGQSASTVFVALLEFVCPPGGAVDEAIARQAMLNAIADLAKAEVAFDALNADQLQGFFIEFIVRSIEGRVMADLGHRAISMPADVAAVQRVQDQLHDFVAGCTRNALTGRLVGVARMTDQQINQRVTEIYEAAFDLVEAAAEEAGS